MRRFLPFAALIGVALVLGCQDVGTGPDGLVPQFDKPYNDDPCPAGRDNKGHCHDDEEPPPPDDGDDCGKHCVFVNVGLGGWMQTDPLNQINQMELARKPGIMKIRANTEKAGTKFLKFAINMPNTLAALTFGETLEKQRISLGNECVWWGRVEETEENENWVIEFMLPPLLNDIRVVERSVLVVIDESAFVQGPDGTFVSVSENNTMGIWPTTPGTPAGFGVKGGAPTVTVVAPPAGSDFTATFSGGKVELTVNALDPEERNVIHLRCNIYDDITFRVMSQGS